MSCNLSISRMAYRSLFHALELCKYDLDKFTKETGISHDFTSNFDETVTASEYYQAWHDAIRLTKQPLLGLVAGTRMHPGNLGALGYSMMNCETTGESLQLCFRYNHMGNSSIISHLEQDGEDLTITLETPFFTPEFVAPWIELLAGSYGRMFHQLTNFGLVEKYNYRAVYFKHKPLGPIEGYEKLLRCPVYFEQDEYRFVVDKGIFYEKVHQADTAVLSSLISTISSVVGPLPGNTANGTSPILSVADQVKQYVRKHMSSGLPSADIVADALNISISTLKRRLRLEGQNYRDLTQDLRMEIAKELLSANILSIYEISFMLGFATSTSFSRAFKLWTGEAPSKYR